MPLTLTITDPLSLTEAERFAVLTFCQIRVTERDSAKIASEPRDSVREVIKDMAKPRGEVVQLHASTGDPTSRGEVRIDPLDDPSHGIVPVPPVPASVTPIVPSGRAMEGDAAPAGPDFAKVFGGATAAPSVPIPPSAAPTTKSPDLVIPSAVTSPNLGAASTSAPAVPSVPRAPAPGASAPSAGASDALPPAAPPNPSNALDVNGMPWDHRIHATTKTKNADGTWRMKRGVDEKLVADVIDQNKRLMAIAPPAVPAAPAPSTGAPPVPTAAPTGMTFAELMEQVIRLINGGKITIEAANAACMPMGLTFLHQLDKRPDLIDGAWAHIRSAAGVA